LTTTLPAIAMGKQFLYSPTGYPSATGQLKQCNSTIVFSSGYDAYIRADVQAKV
jgi:hypothetical protein